ncbi:MAG: cobalamin B12-binding domain-containing protein [Deltaproteobacteria bacterium]|nr:cobalamin B12-binding domain-containing protein [Deltaproteobacteria bacterium]
MERAARIRVLIAKVGLDAHERGAKLVAMALRNAGMEVIYTGLRNTPEMVAQAVLQENVDVVGLSSLAGAHVATARMVSEALQQKGVGDVLFVMGGIIPKKDFDTLKKFGVQGIFSVHSTFDDIIDFIRKNVSPELRVSA